MLLNKVRDDIGKDAGKYKDSGGKQIDSLRPLSGFQAGATQLWVSRAGHARGFVIDHTGDNNHRQSKQANRYFVLG
jgi:hypothetical protein